jgi:pilus assembly protein CpaF
VSDASAAADNSDVAMMRISQAAVKARELLDDPSTTELHFIGKDQWFVKQGGRLALQEQAFSSEEELVSWVNALLEQCGSPERIDGYTWRIEASYLSETVRARVHVICPPVAERVTVTIAKQQTESITIADMVAAETLSEEMAAFLATAVAGGLRIVVAGCGGAGKTTLINALASLCDPAEALIVVQEEANELNLPQADVRYMYSRAVRASARVDPSLLVTQGALWAAETVRNYGPQASEHFSFEGLCAWIGAHADDLFQGGSYSPVGLGSLVEEAMRMRPDRIIVGEVRKAEALDLLEAFNSGTPGFTSVHANGPYDAIEKLKLLALKHASHPQPIYVASLIASAVDLVVYLSAPEMGQHRVSAIMEVDRNVLSDGKVTHEDLYTWTRKGGFQAVQRASRALIERMTANGIVGLA